MQNDETLGVVCFFFFFFFFSVCITGCVCLHALLQRLAHVSVCVIWYGCDTANECAIIIIGACGDRILAEHIDDRICAARFASEKLLVRAP